MANGWGRTWVYQWQLLNIQGLWGWTLQRAAAAVASAHGLQQCAAIVE